MIKVIVNPDLPPDNVLLVSPPDAEVRQRVPAELPPWSPAWLKRLGEELARAGRVVVIRGVGR